MVIFHKRFHSLLPYCGVFLCRNEDGNRLLREMEPPRHDKWDPDHPEKNAHKKTESEFISYIRDCIQKLSPPDTEKVLSIPDLSQYLPDDEDTPDESFDGEDLSKRESFDRRPEDRKIAGRKMDRSRRQMQPDDTAAGDGELETEEAGGGAGTGGGQGGGSNDVDGGRGGGGGGSEQGSAGPGKGGQHGGNAKPAIPIRGRVFAKDLKKGIYTVIVEPTKPVKCDALLGLKAVADDASASLIAVQNARLDGGKALPTPKPGVIGPVKLNGRGRLVVEIALVEPRKLAMEVEAHEAE